MPEKIDKPAFAKPAAKSYEDSGKSAKQAAKPAPAAPSAAPAAAPAAAAAASATFKPDFEPISSAPRNKSRTALPSQSKEFNRRKAQDQPTNPKKRSLDSDNKGKKAQKKPKYDPLRKDVRRQTETKSPPVQRHQRSHSTNAHERSFQAPSAKIERIDSWESPEPGLTHSPSSTRESTPSGVATPRKGISFFERLAKFDKNTARALYGTGSSNTSRNTSRSSTPARVTGQTPPHAMSPESSRSPSFKFSKY